MDILLPAKGVLPPGIDGYDENFEGVPYDPEGGRAIIEEKGGADLFRDVTLLTSGQGAAPSEALAAVTALWEENLGVSIAIEQEEFGIFLRDIDEGNFSMFSLGWIADYPDPQNFLEIKLHSQSADNETKYSNPDVDALLDQAKTETDEAERDSPLPGGRAVGHRGLAVGAFVPRSGQRPDQALRQELHQRRRSSSPECGTSASRTDVGTLRCRASSATSCDDCYLSL